MDRREFVMLVGAGALFPADFAKALAKPQAVLSESDWRGWYPDEPFIIPSFARVVCFGNDWDPVSGEQLEKIMGCFRAHENFFARHVETPRPYLDSTRIVAESITRIAAEFGTSVKAIYAIPFPLKRLIIGIGSDDRPSQKSDCVAVRNQFDLEGEDWEHLTLVTNHNFYPHEFLGCTLHDPPMVRSHKWTERAVKRGIIRKVAPRWITQDPPIHWDESDC